MDLFPIRVGVTESGMQAPELFFIRASSYSAAYFISNIAPFFASFIEKEDGGVGEEGALSRMHTEIETLIKRFQQEIDAFVVKFPLPKIQVSLDFQVESFLQILDTLVFSFPIGPIPEIYAKDLFLSSGLPEGEVLNMFVFYIREEILCCINAALKNESLPFFSAPVLPEVTVLAPFEKIEGTSLLYSSPGKVIVLKDQEKKKKKR